MANVSSGAFLAWLIDHEPGPVGRLLVDAKRVFAFAFFLTATTEVLSIAPMLYMMNVFDRVMASRSGITLVSLTVLLLALFAFWSTLDWIRNRLMLRYALRLDWDLAVDVFDASFRRFAGQKRLNAQLVMADLEALRSFFQGRALFAVMEAPFAFIFVILAFLFHPYLAFFSFAALVVMLVLAYLKQRAASPLIRNANEAAAETDRMVTEMLRHSETAMALGMLPAIRKRWYQRHQADLLLKANGSEASGLVGGLSTLLTRSMPSLQMGLAIWLAIQGLITGGMVIAAMFLVRKCIHPIETLMNEWGKIMRVRLSIERLEKLLEEDESWRNRMELPPPVGELQVKGLVATVANSKRTILSGIDFSLVPGQVLVVIGPSAAGKSTLVKHLVGILKPALGSVRLDGAEVSEWIRAELGQHIGYVPQDVMIIEGTVAENIARLGEVNPAEVVRAAELVGLHKTILGFPEGYETAIGVGGHVLTGGQKQRLLIARALYRTPKFVVMDEPSSSLDAEAVEALIGAIRELRARHCTVVITTHQTNMIAVADLILVLNQGKQIAFGTPREVAQATGVVGAKTPSMAKAVTRKTKVATDEVASKRDDVSETSPEPFPEHGLPATDSTKVTGVGHA